MEKNKIKRHDEGGEKRHKGGGRRRKEAGEGTCSREDENNIWGEGEEKMIKKEGEKV